MSALVDIEPKIDPPPGSQMIVHAVLTGYATSTQGNTIYLTAECRTHAEFVNEIDILISDLEGLKERAKLKFAEFDSF
ncbi:MAG: hypothetical protein JWM16_5291 [Verrucomicrobiales bacterium]|nr:hypothetical protein [Verrucomicrobiales bacterium]